MNGETQTPEEIPHYTEFEGINRTIHEIASGRDEKHPTYGLPVRLHGLPFEFKKQGEKHISVRIVFPAGNHRELSYLINQGPQGDIKVRSEGWVPED